MYVLPFVNMAGWIHMLAALIFWHVETCLHLCLLCFVTLYGATKANRVQLEIQNLIIAPGIQKTHKLIYV